MKLKALRHYALVSEMIGVEGIVTAELALMIVNLRYLGVSVALTSIPIFASAVTSLVMIPLLGFITVRCAKTARQKALSLVAINVWQAVGAGLAVLANVLRLMEGQNMNGDASRNITTLGYDTTGISQMGVTSPNSSGAFVDLHMGNMSKSSSATEYITAESQTVSSYESEGLNLSAVLAIIGYTMSDSGYDTGSCFLKTFALSATPARDHPEVIVRAIQMSSIGGIIVTLQGAVGIGEVLSEGTNLNVNSVTIIFIIALQVVILVPTSIITLTTGLCCRSGLYDGEDGNGSPIDNNNNDKYEGTTEEKQSLIHESVISTTSQGLDDKINQWQGSFNSIRNNNNNNNNNNNYSYDDPIRHRSGRSRQSSMNRDVMEKIYQLSQSGAHSLIEEVSCASARLRESAATERVGDFVELNGGDPGECLGKMLLFLRHHKKRLILCIGTFFAVGALFSFNMFSVNFVCVSICGGDPNAVPGTAGYDNYLRGIKIGSTGLLVFYTSFVIGTTLQDLLLRRLGWWREASITSILYIVCNITCAIVRLEAFYYISAFVSGLQRATIFTVPYILVCRVLTPSDADSSKPGASKGDNSGDIALVAAMLPLSMIMVAVLINPVIELTGSAATPIFFSGVSCFLGYAAFWSLRKY